LIRSSFLSQALALALLAFPFMGHPAADEPPLKLGAVFNLSGRQAPHDIPSSHGASLAVDEINASGGVLGRTLALVPVDGKTDLTVLKAEIVRSLAANPEILAYFGLSDTDNVLAAAPSAAAEGKVFLTSGATSPELPDEVPTYLFLACFGDNVQAAAAAEWAFTERGAKTAIVLADMQRTYPKLLQNYFAEAFTGLGGRILNRTEIDPDARGWTLPDTSSADMVFVSVETAHNAARIVSALRKQGYQGPVLGGDGYDDDGVWSRNPEIGNVYFTTHVYLGKGAARPEVVSFKDAYAAAFPGEAPTSFAALAYDAAGLLAAAVTTSGEPTKTGILNGLLQIKQFDGVTGKISFPDGSRIPLKSVSLIEVSEGELRLAKEILPGSVPAP